MADSGESGSVLALYERQVEFGCKLFYRGRSAKNLLVLFEGCPI